MGKNTQFFAVWLLRKAARIYQKKGGTLTGTLLEHSKNQPEHVPAMFRAMFRLKPLKIKAFLLTGTLEHLFSIKYKNREIRGFRENINALNRLCACIYARDVPDVPPLKRRRFFERKLY